MRDRTLVWAHHPDIPGSLTQKMRGALAEGFVECDPPERHSVFGKPPPKKAAAKKSAKSSEPSTPTPAANADTTKE